jgi:cytoskeletal protein CcmA (bactofilin family)
LLHQVFPERSVGDRTGEPPFESLEGDVWKKDEEQPVRPATTTTAPAASTEAVRAPAVRSGHATIGPSIVIKGEVSGNEDLLIQGRIDGSVDLDTHSVTVGGGGRVKANITGRVITVEGNVEGDLKAQEQIVLRGSAKVLGDLTAPRVVLEDGASFRGLVDMGAAREGEKGEADRVAASAPKVGASKSGGVSSPAAQGSSVAGKGVQVPAVPAGEVGGGGKGAPERRPGS